MSTKNTFKSVFIAKRAELDRRQRQLAADHDAAIAKINAERTAALKLIRAERKALYEEYDKSCAALRIERAEAKAAKLEAAAAAARAEATEVVNPDHAEAEVNTAETEA